MELHFLRKFNIQPQLATLEYGRKNSICRHSKNQISKSQDLSQMLPYFLIPTLPCSLNSKVILYVNSTGTPFRRLFNFFHLCLEMVISYVLFLIIDQYRLSLGGFKSFQISGSGLGGRPSERRILGLRILDIFSRKSRDFLIKAHKQIYFLPNYEDKCDESFHI